MKSKLYILSLIATFFILAGLGCKTSSSARNYAPVTLRYWGVFEDSNDIKKLTSSYTKRHPKIGIQYTRFREDEYKEKMLEGWALGQGPDLFMIPSTRIREFLKFLTPMPETMEAPVLEVKGTLKKEFIDDVRTYNGYSLRQIRDIFLDVVAEDVVIDGKIYGLPYSVDTLSIYYNRDLLKENNIPLAATNWTELIEQASIISKVNSDDQLVQSAIALGTTRNIPAALDIVSTLMMQVGIEMGNSKEPLFHKNKESLNPIQFYLSFAQNSLQNYSWNEDMPDALDAFTSGKLAYFIGYPYHAQLITQINPKLNYDIIPFFRPENVATSPNYASYWLTVVAKPPKGASKLAQQRAELSWQYLSESTNARNVRAFLSNPENPRTTALRSLIEDQKNDFILGPFAENLLNAKSWYRGYDYDFAENAFLDMIENIAHAYQNNLDPETFLQAGGDLVNQTYKPPR